MTHDSSRTRRALSRRGALLLPLAVGGCSIFDGWFDTKKDPLPGDRIPILAADKTLIVDTGVRRTVTIPPARANLVWPQVGNTPSHDGGNWLAREQLARIWTADIGVGGGYRRKLMCQPLVADGRLIAMDSDANIVAIDAATGSRLWQTDTEDEDNRSTNIGGGIAVADGIVYASTGRAEILALDAATGVIKWRKALDMPARSPPTVADGKIFVSTLGNELLALSATDGAKLWSYKARSVGTAVLGVAAPAYADGIVVAGFSTGDLAAVRVSSGSALWGDSMAASRGRTSRLDLSAILGLTVIQDGRVFAIGLGQLMLGIDLRSGRRLWERDVASAETPLLVGDFAFVVNATGLLAALDRNDGSVAWTNQLPQFEDEEKSENPIFWKGPLLAGGRLILASSNAILLQANPVTGEIIGRQPLPAPAAQPPILADGTVYIMCLNGTVVALK